MCGRFTLAADAETFAEDIRDLEVEFKPAPRYNIAPTQSVATILNEGRAAVVATRWGLVPSWAQDPAVGARMINARAETLAEKPSFREAFRRRRCLILADGFYEWKSMAGRRQKVPYYIRLKAGKPFAFAGLWDTWRDAQQKELKSCAIITTTPNEMLAPLHDRMPVILPPVAYGAWLATEPQDSSGLQMLLSPYPAGEMEAYPVSTRVNRVSFDDPSCIVPVASGDLFSST